MINLNIDEARMDKIISAHKEYIIETAYKRMELIIENKRLNKSKKIKDSKIKEDIPEDKDNNEELADKYIEFIEKFFGNGLKLRKNKIVEICTSSKLEEINKEFNNNFTKYFNLDYVKEKGEAKKNIPKEVITVEKIINKIFDYDGFNKGTNIQNHEFGKWNRHNFVTFLSTRVCPYCNRNYITSYEYDGSKEQHTTADVDHYYPKSLYPILQMNIYNMIPSCNVCNSKTKLNSDLRHLNPYVDKNDSLKFETTLDTLGELYNYSKSPIYVKPKGDKAENSKKVFKLEKIYQTHENIVTDIKNRFSHYLAFSNEYYRQTMGLEIMEDEDIYRYWFDFLGMEEGDEPLTKLKQDIYYQLSEVVKQTPNNY